MSVFVRVKLAGETYALPVENILEVTELGKVAPVPRAPRSDPGGLRIGLSPLSTSFEEVHRGIAATRDTLKTVLQERAGLA